MARHRHRVFEIYDDFIEAVQALAPRGNQVDDLSTELAALTLNHISASYEKGLAHVAFPKTKNLEFEQLAELRADLSSLTELLPRDCRIVVDFQGIESLDVRVIEVFVLWCKHLKNRGSRMVICQLAPSVYEAFFSMRHN